MVLPSGKRLKALSRPTALGAAASWVNVFASQMRRLSGSSFAEMISWSSGVTANPMTEPWSSFLVPSGFPCAPATE